MQEQYHYPHVVFTDQPNDDAPQVRRTALLRGNTASQVLMTLHGAFAEGIVEDAGGTTAKAILQTDKLAAQFANIFPYDEAETPLPLLSAVVYLHPGRKIVTVQSEKVGATVQMLQKFADNTEQQRNRIVKAHRRPDIGVGSMGVPMIRIIDARRQLGAIAEKVATELDDGFHAPLNTYPERIGFDESIVILPETEPIHTNQGDTGIYDPRTVGYRWI